MAALAQNEQLHNPSREQLAQAITAVLELGWSDGKLAGYAEHASRSRDAIVPTVMKCSVDDQFSGPWRLAARLITVVVIVGSGVWLLGSKIGRGSASDAAAALRGR
ncbi:MAG: hypothetical protein JRF63_12440 [Deltaproteobacteria bacterium]|nr:hypothetical protein [Deltaproteobacteria bacterium]